MGSKDRMTADMHPRVVEVPQGFSREPVGAVRHVELFHGEDRAGWVWAGDGSAGFLPDPGMVAYAAAAAMTWEVAGEVYREGLPAAVVLRLDRYMDPWRVGPVVEGFPEGT